MVTNSVAEEVGKFELAQCLTKVKVCLFLPWKEWYGWLNLAGNYLFISTTTC